jgi:hypothetical protein
VYFSWKGLLGQHSSSVMELNPSLAMWTTERGKIKLLTLLSFLVSKLNLYFWIYIYI